MNTSVDHDAVPSTSTVPESRPGVDRPAAGAAAFGRTVLVATDGSGHADGAVAVGLELARTRGAVVRVLSVVEHSLTMPATRGHREQIEIDRRDRRRDEVVRQLARLGAADDGDELEVVDGAAVATIASAAAEADASLVVLGLHTHGFVDRMFRDETALRVLRRVRSPLLAVRPDQRGLPRDAVAAIDFGPASLAATREGAALLADGGCLRLLHAVPQTSGGEWAAALEQLDVFAAELTADHNLLVECVIRCGDPFAALDDELRERPTELVALGCGGCTATDPGRPGRLTSAYVRAAGVSLVVGTPGNAPVS